MTKKNWLEPYEKEECLKQAVEIARAYASSGENKHGPVTELIENIYNKLLQIRSDIKLDAKA